MTTKHEAAAALAQAKLFADVAAQELILTHLLANLAENSPQIRRALEHLMGQVRPMNQSASAAKDEAELRRLMCLNSTDRILADVSSRLSNPLMPRGGVRLV